MNNPRAAAIGAGGLRLLSASQVQLWRECPRKWAFKYIAKIQSPKTPSQLLGDEVDSWQLQPYLRHGDPINFSRDSGYIAAAGLALLPSPRAPGLELQKRFIIPSPTWREGKHCGVAFQGFIDLWANDSRVMPGMQGNAPLVCDFKTTVDISKYAKNEDDLRTDTQAQLYATAAMYITGARVVDLAWVYFQTRGAKRVKRTHLRVVADQVSEQFEAINETALEIARARAAAPDPLALPPNPEQCEAFGGCPHRAKCNLSPSQRLAALEAREARERGAFMSNVNPAAETANMFAALEAQRAQALGQPAPQPAPAPAQPAPTMAQADPRFAIVGTKPDGSPLYAWECMPNPNAPVPPGLVPQQPVVNVAPTYPQGFGQPIVGSIPPVPSYPQASLGINPPEAALPPAPPINVAPPPPAAPSAEPPKRGRGRPPKSPSDPVAADAHAAIDVDALASALAPRIAHELVAMLTIGAGKVG